MHSFREHLTTFEEKFGIRHFPYEPSTLYEPAQYILTLGGKRIRPVMCLMGNELVNKINPDTYHAAIAIELFHNFTLIHDDIMDKAPLRRGMETVHIKFGEPSALLAGDVMLVVAYDHLNKLDKEFLHKVIRLFNKTARQVCEGQQLDMDFSLIEKVSLTDYINMIELKTSVLLAASLQIGAILGGAGEGNQSHLYEFGKNLGIAFQVQDDYLDAFGNEEKFGKQIGGDIVANKKTFLSIHVMDVATKTQLDQIKKIKEADDKTKVEKTLQLYRETDVDKWAKELKEKYYLEAMHHLEEIAVLSSRKKYLKEVAGYLMDREH